MRNITMEWYKSEATHEPKIVDCDSSSTTVFLRRNVEQIEKSDESGRTYTAWEYDEAKITHEQYEEILSAGITALEESSEAISEAVDIVMTEELPAQSDQIDSLSDAIDDILTNVIPNLIEED